MSYRQLIPAAAMLLCATTSLAQGSGPARSHVERFSTLEMRAERLERDAAARLAKNPDDADALNDRAAARMGFGRYREALEDLRRAVSVRPASAPFRAALGYALWKLGRPDEAVAEVSAAVRLDEKNFSARYQLGRYLLRLGGRERLPEAVEHLRRAAEIDPRQYDVRFELIAAYRASGDRAQASGQLDFLADARPSDPRVFYVSALLATDRDDLSAAVRDFNEALRRDPEFDAARQDLGMAYIRLKRWPEALAAFSELARRRPESVDGAYLHALALYNGGRAEEAERETRRALRLNAGAAEAHTLLGVILAARGNANAEAAEALSQAVALNPQSFDARFYLGRVLYAVKDYAGAVRDLREAVRLNPRHAEARFFLGTALESSGESEPAMAEYEELLRLDPGSVYGQVGLGAQLVKRGRLEEAIAALNRATARDPQNFEAHLALGRAYALAERYEEAVAALQKASVIGPSRVDAHYQLGLALRRLGRHEEAAREFAVVEKLNTEFRTGASTRR